MRTSGLEFFLRRHMRLLYNSTESSAWHIRAGKSNRSILRIVSPHVANLNCVRELVLLQGMHLTPQVKWWGLIGP